VGMAYDFPDPEQLFLPPQVNPSAAPTQEQIDQQNQQQQQAQLTQGNGGQQTPTGEALQQMMYDIRQPQIGDVYGSRSRPLQGEIPIDPQLAAALGRIRPF